MKTRYFSFQLRLIIAILSIFCCYVLNSSISYGAGGTGVLNVTPLNGADAEGFTTLQQLQMAFSDYGYLISLCLLVFGGVMWFFNRPAFTIGALVAAAVIYGGPHLANGIRAVSQ
ncbi:hypothetical protein A946_10040 [Methylacidiphilum kamchatkense Kam1]|uniref:TrbC/VIRB2 family protein n=1 Tax=Methylacidiphilum kamchatkense Kam1 TaxID=1202785 RepID=A0A0C1V2T4_9BACT|nr:hypothetical protein [Methylacidiphilum kamchatkense]KIE57980.1 hypothetical protein A946_10040 [Methylacidiphilum kamchatkense Kam1]QDQ42413.1 hypothetical protein kam1_1185 [Methylacidiphilum kamchatkense Kam1]